MAQTLQHIIDFLNSPSNNADGYNSLPYHGAIMPILLVNVAYMVFVFKLGPWLMRNRQPYNIKNLLLAYNFAQIVYNAIIAYLACSIVFYHRASPISCILRLPDDHPLKTMEAITCMLYLYNKFADYLDTVFFVMRKSHKQVTFLHVYHHLIMTTSCFVYVKYYGFGGHPGMIGLLNSIVHVFMYAYYLISALRPQMKQSLWWKKYITLLQLAQFVIILVHQTWPLIFNRSCNYPSKWIVFSSLQAILMIYLFGNFYRRTYMQGPAKDSRPSTKPSAKAL